MVLMCPNPLLQMPFSDLCPGTGHSYVKCCLVVAWKDEPLEYHNLFERWLILKYLRHKIPVMSVWRDTDKATWVLRMGILGAMDVGLVSGP